MLCLGKFPTEQFKINLADVELLGVLFTAYVHLNVFVHNLVQFHHQIHIGHMTAFCLQVAGDRVNRVYLVAIFGCDVFAVRVAYQARKFGGVCGEGLLVFCRRTDCICRVLDCGNLIKALGFNNLCKGSVEAA